MTGDKRTDSLNARLRTPAQRYGNRLKSRLSAEVLQAKIMAKELEGLQRTFEHLKSNSSVTQAATAILGARRKFIYGEGKSAAYAQLLAADLTATLSNIVPIDGRGISQLAVLSDVRSTDVLIAFSFRRYRLETVRFAQQFAAAGGTLVVFTDSVESPLGLVGDVVIDVDTGSVSYADSATPVAAACHLLSTLTSAGAKGARRRLSVRDEYSKILELYVEDQP